MKRYASILLAGYPLIACILAAQDPQRSANDKQCLVFTIALMSVPEKPISAKFGIEVTRILADGKVVHFHTEKVQARDDRGRIYEERSSFVPPNSDRSPELEEIDLFDPSARIATLCVLKTKHCVIANYTPAQEFNKSCTSQPTPQNVAVSWSNLGQHEIGGITVTRTRETCIPGGSVDYWRNSELGIDLNVISSASFPSLGHEVWVWDWRLIEATQSKPAPQLFDIPIGFTVGDSRK